MSDPTEPRDDTDRHNFCPLCDQDLDAAGRPQKRLTLNDDTITGIALVPAVTIARRHGLPPAAYDEVLALVKETIAEALRVANDDSEQGE